MMRKPVQKIALTAALSAIAMFGQAEGISPGAHLVLNGGFTGGGDTIDTTVYVSGDSVDITAGGLVQFGAGLLWQFSDMPVALQLTANYHVDGTSATNGSAKFDRTPIELSFFYTGLENWRFGLGARFVQSPKYKYHVDGGTNKMIDYKKTTGALIEVGYGFTKHSWLNFRLVSEKYQATTQNLNGVVTNLSNTPAVDGSHFGISYLHVF